MIFRHQQSGHDFDHGETSTHLSEHKRCVLAAPFSSVVYHLQASPSIPSITTAPTLVDHYLVLSFSYHFFSTRHSTTLPLSHYHPFPFRSTS